MKKTISFFFVTVVLLITGCVTHKDISREKQNKDPLLMADEQETVITQTQVSKKTQNDSLQLKLLQMDSSLRKLRGHIEVLDKKYQDQDQKLKSILTTLEKKEQEVLSKKKQDLSEKNNEDFFTQAEDFFKKNNWKSAIIYYEKHREHKGKKDSLYKKATFQIGLCFKELKMETEAKVFFREIISSFPQSSEAKQAKNLLLEKNP